MSKVKVDLNNKTILVTGSPGFIGANLVLRLLKEMKSGTVISLDNMNDYYDPALKEYRLGLIEEAAKTSPVKHIFIKGSIADKALIDQIFAEIVKENIPLGEVYTCLGLPDKGNHGIDEAAKELLKFVVEK